MSQYNYCNRLVREIYSLNKQARLFDMTKEELFLKVGRTGKELAAFKRSLKQIIYPKKKLIIEMKIIPNTEFLKRSVYTLDIPPRSHKYFRHLKINTVEDLLQFSAKDLLSLRNCGVKTIKAIQTELKYNGYSLKK